jgi:hypothetical protein
MTDVKRWCENPVNGGPWVVLESDYDALAARVSFLSSLCIRAVAEGWSVSEVMAELTKDTADSATASARG